jgi:hypothetical protein
VDAFFYGLFMDSDLLRSKGLAPKDPELASVSGLALRIGQRAALVPDPSGRVHGVVMSLRLDELERLYAEPGVREYRPQAVLAELAGGGVTAALCYNLATPPGASERNSDYVRKLRAAGEKVGLPADYLSALV